MLVMMPATALAGGAGGTTGDAVGQAVLLFMGLPFLVVVMGFVFALLDRRSGQRKWRVLNLSTLSFLVLLAALWVVLGMRVDPKFFNLLGPLGFALPQLVMTMMRK